MPQENNETLFRKDLEDFRTIIAEIRIYQKKQASLKWNFWRGVFYGFGFFVGSALIATALVYILDKISVNGNGFFTEIIRKIVEVVRSVNN